jgi:hypothetical protein
MPKSDRDPARLAREREARLAARMAKECLKSGAVEDATKNEEDPTEVDQKFGLSRDLVDPSTDKGRSSISIDVG